MNKLSIEDRVKIVACLCDGNSIRATCRITGAAKNTVVRLLTELGPICKAYQDVAFRELPCKRLQVDEIWSFCYAKEKNVPEAVKGELGYGDVWTFTAICADSKLVPCWHVGRRDAENATGFMVDLASRLANRIQLTTDGHRMYLVAVDQAFQGDVDYAMLNKVYGGESEGEKRYSPAKFIAGKKEKINGKPLKSHISTSFVERQNLNMRMGMRRFTRLTNAFSKKLENHEAAISLFYMYYNFVRIHQTLRVTPAMESGVADHPWEIADIVALLD